MDSIGQYVTQEPAHGRAYFLQRAARHQQEAERLYRLGDARQAEMHASIARKHADRARALPPDGADGAPVTGSTAWPQPTRP